MSDLRILTAAGDDWAELATLHVDSWRSAYRGLLPDEFLDGPIAEERRQFWQRRMSEQAEDRRVVLKAVSQTGMVGFACVLLDVDPPWGPRLENLHVAPSLKGRGIGRALFEAAQDWIARVAPGEPMHLWVLEQNSPSRAFYDHLGGTVADRKMIEVVPGITVPEVRYVWPATRPDTP